MYVLLSGEGPGDMGVCNVSVERCDRDAFNEGPMAIIVDQLLELYQGYEMSYLDTARVSFVSEAFLAANKRSPNRKAMTLKGKKRPAETKYYYENARVLAETAKEKSKAVNDTVVAVLFRDADGTASAGRGNWRDKRNSMIEGFNAEKFEYGVAMMPKPKSEAWLLCATKKEPYQHCASLEDESGSDKGKHPLKQQLSESLGGNSSTANLNQLLREKSVDATQIDMPSFNAFKTDLEQVVMLASGVKK